MVSLANAWDAATRLPDLQATKVLRVSKMHVRVLLSGGIQCVSCDELYICTTACAVPNIVVRCTAAVSRAYEHFAQ